MSVVLTKTPHQKITQTGISSQWEGKHIRFTDKEFQGKSFLVHHPYNLTILS